MDLALADQVTMAFMDRVRASCERIDVVGSITRREPVVKDADIILIPKMVDVLDMFQEPTGEKWSQVDEALSVMFFQGIFEYAKDRHGNDIDGEKHKKLMLRHYDLVIELWIVTPPAQWGVIKMLRTGPQDWSHQVVTKRNKMTGRLTDGRQVPGLLPSNCTMDKGQVFQDGKLVELHEEIDFFKFIGLAWIPPESRCAGYMDQFVKWPMEKSA